MAIRHGDPCDPYRAINIAASPFVPHGVFEDIERRWPVRAIRHDTAIRNGGMMNAAFDAISIMQERIPGNGVIGQAKNS